jgi:hypothetical protein
MEHEILIARAFLASGAPYFMRFNMVFPSGTHLQTAFIRKETEREFQAGGKAVICHKLRIEMQGSWFYSFVDKQQELPVYLIFPGTLTECFLESFFGENPKPLYRETEETPGSAAEER